MSTYCSATRNLSPKATAGVRVLVSKAIKDGPVAAVSRKEGIIQQYVQSTRQRAAMHAQNGGDECQSS